MLTHAESHSLKLRRWEPAHPVPLFWFCPLSIPPSRLRSSVPGPIAANLHVCKCQILKGLTNRLFFLLQPPGALESPVAPRGRNAILDTIILSVRASQTFALFPLAVHWEKPISGQDFFFASDVRLTL